MNKEEIPIEYYLTKNGEVIKFVRYDELDKYKQVIDKIKEYIKENSKNISITPNSVKAVPVEYILELLEEIE